MGCHDIIWVVCLNREQACTVSELKTWCNYTGSAGTVTLYGTVSLVGQEYRTAPDYSYRFSSFFIRFVHVHWYVRSYTYMCQWFLRVVPSCCNRYII